MKVKSRIIRGCLYVRDRNIKCLQALAWWVTDLILQRKYIESNNFNGDSAIDESKLNYKDNRDTKE